MYVGGFGHDDGDWEWLHGGVIPFSLVVTWVFIGVTMLMQTVYRLRRSITKTNASPAQASRERERPEDRAGDFTPLEVDPRGRIARE